MTRPAALRFRQVVARLSRLSHDPDHDGGDDGVDERKPVNGSPSPRASLADRSTRRLDPLLSRDSC